MGYIRLNIQQDNQIKPFIIFSADYLNEAWVAESLHNGRTKIIKQFKCRKFQLCFNKLSDFIKRLGEVKEFNATGIEEHDITLLRQILTNHSHHPHKTNVFSGDFLRQITQKIWGRQNGSSPGGMPHNT